MIKLLTKKISLLVFFLIGVGIFSTATAQQNQASQGNIIQNVSISPQGGTSLLLIKGILDPTQLENISISQQGDTTYVISIPNALIDPEKIPELSQKFSLRDPIKLINFDENIREIGNDVVFTVDLRIEARNSIKMEIVRPVTSSMIRIGIQDMQVVRERERAAQEEMEKKKKEEEQARMAALKKKKEGQQRVHRTTAEAQQAVSEILKHYHRPSVMQLSIINASGWEKRAYKLSVFLGKEKKREIEESLGIKLDIVNISNAKNNRHNQSTIYFRNNFLKPALFLARIIPGEQKLVPVDETKKRMGVDIEIYLGVDYK